MTERYVTMAEVKELLNKAGETEGRLGTLQNAAMTHSQYITLSADDAEKLVAELKELKLSTSDGKEYVPSEAIVYKMADLLPKTKTDIRAIISKERIVLSDDSMKAILETILKYE